MNGQQQLNAMARLAGNDPLKIGDLADAPIIGRCQIIRIDGSQIAVIDMRGNELTVRRQLLQKVKP